MFSSFSEMPKLLRFLTIIALASIIFLPATIFSSGVDIGSHVVVIREWWENGSGYILTIAIFLMVSSGILMLRRARHSRIVYLIGWIFLNSSVFVIRRINDMVMLPIELYIYVGFSIFSVIFFAIYLYTAGGPRSYFDGGQPSS